MVWQTCPATATAHVRLALAPTPRPRAVLHNEHQKQYPTNIPPGSDGSDGWSIGGSIPSIPYEGDSITRDAVGRTMHRGLHGEQYAEQYGVERRYVLCVFRYLYGVGLWRSWQRHIFSAGQCRAEAYRARRSSAPGGRHTSYDL